MRFGGNGGGPNITAQLRVGRGILRVLPVPRSPCAGHSRRGVCAERDSSKGWLVGTRRQATGTVAACLAVATTNTIGSTPAFGHAFFRQAVAESVEPEGLPRYDSETRLGRRSSYPTEPRNPGRLPR